MKTIERLRELLESAKVEPNITSVPEINAWCDRRDELFNTLPALLAVVEAQAAEIEKWRGLADARFNGRTMYEGDQFQTIRDARTNTDAALRALEGGE